MLIHQYSFKKHECFSTGEALPMLSSLEELDLSNNKLSIKGMEDFTSSLGSTPRLKTLKLSMCGLSKDSLSVLGMKALIKSPSK